MSGQARLVTELYSQGQASMVLAQQSLVQPIQTSMGPSKFLEVVPPASRSTYNPFKVDLFCSFLFIFILGLCWSTLHDSQLKNKRRLSHTGPLCSPSVQPPPEMS